jgi:hypothetical protein
MSFDLYLISFTNGQQSGVPRESVLAAFGEYVRWDEDGDGWTRYSGRDDGCRIGVSQFKDDPALISFIALNRPLSDKRFLESLHRIMRLGNAALVYPGFKGPLIASPSVADHLPSKLLDRGPAIVVNSGDEITERIRSS